MPQFGGLRITADAKAAMQFEGLRLVQCLKGKNRIVLDKPGVVGWGGNSGFQALNLAIQFGAQRIILVGFDMQITRGIHWHGRHGHGLNNPAESNMRAWRRHLAAAAPVIAAMGVEVINASRETALTCFPRMTLQDALAC